MQNNNSFKVNKFMTRNEVATLFRISYPTLYKWIKLNLIPSPIKIGGKVLWLSDEINTIAKK